MSFSIKNKWLILMLLVIFVFTFTASIVYGQKKEIKTIPSKTYWCAEIADILYPKEPVQGQKFSVGVRVKFTSKTIMPGLPSPKLCSCAFEGPSGVSTKFWAKTMSLRLIGIKYSQHETNLLEYYGPTPAFPPYDYSGFPVIGFMVTENDLNRGYMDVWGWSSKEPLQNREFKIYITLDVNGYALKIKDDPDYLKKGCFPSEDFVKSFKPRTLEVPKIDEERIKKTGILRLPPEKFSFQQLPPIKFHPFSRSDFQKAIKLINGQEFITLKNRKTIPFDKFLKEVNEIEEKLNKTGYTLRDKTPVKIRYIYPMDKLDLQKRMFLKQFSPETLSPANPCQSNLSSPKGQQDTGCPKDFVPLNWERAWDASFGNEDFGVEVGSSIKVEGKKESVDIKGSEGKPGFFWATIKLFKKNIPVLLIDKNDSKLEARLLEKSATLSLQGSYKKELFNKSISYSQEISFPIGPIEVTGEFGFKGKAKLPLNVEYFIHSPHAMLELTPYLLAQAYGQLGVGYEIVEVGVEGDLTLIEASPIVVGSIKYIPPPDSSFQFIARANNNLTLLKGSLSVYAEIDYWLDSKKFEVEFFKWDGITLNQPIFHVAVQKEPAEKCHRAWLKIEDIRGVTSWNARGEKLEVEPLEFDVIVTIGGRSYVKKLRDFNKDGVYGSTMSETPFSFNIPLLSYEKVPITIEVKEKYKIGTLDFQSELDFAKGETKKVELCYDPDSRTFSGTVSGKEEDEIVASGDTSYWGERTHGIRFKITSESPFKAAPAKAK